MRKIGIAAGLAMVLSLAACGSHPAQSATQVAAMQRTIDIYEIGQIEANWHKASSTKNIDLMMSLWADNATATLGGQTYSGKGQIRNFFLTKAAPFQPQNDWISDTPAFKLRVTVDGDKGTLYFECHYIDVHTGKVVSVVAADQDVARIKGHWLITNSVSATPSLSAGY